MRLHSREALPHEQEVLDRRPPTDATLTLAVDCWHTLGTCRIPTFFGSGRIPYTAFLDWAREHGLDWHSRQRMWSVIERLDGNRAEREASKARSQGAS